jgi:hypothetical protein
MSTTGYIIILLLLLSGASVVFITSQNIGIGTPTIQARVTANGDWSGAISQSHRCGTFEGNRIKTYVQSGSSTITVENPDKCISFAFSQWDSSGRFKVEIIKNGQVLSEDSTDSTNQLLFRLDNGAISPDQQDSGSSSNINTESYGSTAPHNRNVNGNFVKVSLDDIANAPIDHVSSRYGDVNFGNVPFYINREFTTRDQGNPNRPTEGTLSVNIPSPQRVYVLLNGAYVSQSSEGDQVGNINFEFNDGSDLTYPIIAGNNLRETWSASGTITRVSDSSFYNVLTQSQTRGSQSTYGYMDRYTVEIPYTYQSKTMTGIQIIDTSYNNVGSDNPGLVVQGITVEQI